jgi:2-(1,2-epoxy-1,2-dihydrophenyl)acetyl-CoA isomerase
LRAGAGLPLAEQLAEEARSIAVLAGGTEAQDAMESFLAARSRTRAPAERSADQEPQSVS